MIINVDKFVASLIESTSGINQIIHIDLLNALKEQGLEYKNGEIVKTQRRIVAEAKEAIFDNEDERIRKEIIDYFINDDKYSVIKSPKYKELVALFEKQKDIDSKEYVFRPLAGCDINTAAIQAVEQQKLGNKIVLAFNGAYIPVKEKTADDIVNEYYSWVEKQGEQKPILDFKASNWYVSKVDGKIHDLTYNPTDKKELKKLTQSVTKISDKVWSEEDEKIYNAMIKASHCALKGVAGKIDYKWSEIAEWLQSLKKRIKGE